LTAPRSRAAADTYHHGNLRQALLEHAVELARAGGPDAVVLRDVQRMAGVSNSAAYRHYADRNALLAAVTTYAEARLANAMVARLNAVPQRGPRAKRALGRLRATGQGYIDFALAEPGLFRTAFAHKDSPGRGHSRRTEDAGAAVGEHHPFQILIRCIDDLVATGVLSPDRREGLDEAAWAAVHGLSTLFLDGPLSAADAARKQLITDRLLDVVAEGLR
jgi:AcrR family transcriptional regulator